MSNLVVSNLTEEQKYEVVQIKDTITLSYENTLQYGSSAVKNLSRFSNELLESVKVKDTPEIEGFIMELMNGLAEVDPSTLLKKKSNIFKKFFRIDDIKSFVTKYDSVAKIIASVANKLEQAEFQLKVDIQLCDKYLERNLNYIRELDKYIMAGNMKIEECRNELQQEEAQIDENDRLAVHQFSTKRDEVDRLERKIYDFMLMREIAIQNIPQINLIKGGNAVLIEKLQTSIHSAIPLWESQMIIAIQLMRQKGALAIQKTVYSTTNKMFEKNSELLKIGAIEIAQELERGVVDIEVLRKTSNNLIETLKGIKDVRKEGKQERAKAIQEIALLQSKLNDALLLEARSVM